MEGGITEGENPVRDAVSAGLRGASKESGSLRLLPKTGGRPHRKLNMSKRPIANKYREGKMKRTLKRELKVREVAIG